MSEVDGQQMLVSLWSMLANLNVIVMLWYISSLEHYRARHMTNELSIEPFILIYDFFRR